MTQEDILKRLKFTKAESFLSGFDRPNILYRVVPKKNVKTQLIHFLKEEHPNDAGIVYCLSRKKVERTAEWLQSHGWKALPYHAGLNKETRRQNQERFLRDEGIIMVATIAFGMGIDKSNVRFVAHCDLPKSLEAYYQETGRAGRDELPANAWLAYGLGDVITLRQLLEQSEASPEQKLIERQKLNTMLGYCESVTCRRTVLLGYFGETRDAGCTCCDNCLEPVQTWEGTEAAQKALSCVYRTGQRFGVGHLINVLLGKDSDQVLYHRHETISTYGIGQDLSRSQWHSVFRQLIAESLLSVDHEAFGALQLNETSYQVLKGQRTVQFRHDPKPKKKERPLARSTDYGELLSDEDEELWQQLRALRLQLAKKQDVPPYVIFHDRTLKEMIFRNPKTLAEMSEITGIGERKLTSYGVLFLETLQGYQRP
jgi:ATP-dependent DNA helicase RecQ